MGQKLPKTPGKALIWTLWSNTLRKESQKNTPRIGGQLAIGLSKMGFSAKQEGNIP